jgi:hypothetical protein
MSRERAMRMRGRLVYPGHRFRPEDWLGFTEMKPFTRLWQRLELTDEDLQLVQMAIMCDPSGPPVIPGTGRLRKLRFAPVGSAKGKSGGMRVCYAYFEEHQRVILALVYPKSQKEDLTAEEKAAIKTALEQIKKEFDNIAS